MCKKGNISQVAKSYDELKGKEEVEFVPIIESFFSYQALQRLMDG